MSSLFSLDGKVAVITGSTKGIGKAIAKGLAEFGAQVVISSRKADKCDEVAGELSAAGHKALAVPCNIGHKDQLQNLVDTTVEAFGKIDILVCNAAINPFYGASADESDEIFDKVMRTNIRSNLWLAHMVLPGMVERRDGVIIIVSSIGGLLGSKVIGSYCISKAADMQIARNLAVEYGPHNIRVNAIAPGLVKTDFARALWEDPEYLEKTVSVAPLHRIGEPDEIAGAAVYLASPAGSFMTGQTMVIDGGVAIGRGG